MKLLHKLVNRKLEARRACVICLGFYFQQNQQLLSHIWNCADVCEVAVCLLFLYIWTYRSTCTLTGPLVASVRTINHCILVVNQSE